MNEDYISSIDFNQIYSYDKLISDINQLCKKFPDKIRLEYIGSSVLSRKIPAVILGSQQNSVKYRILIIGNMHARETQSSQIIMRQIEYYLHNWDRKYSGTKIYDLFQNSAIYFIPTANPDGNEIVYDGVRCSQQNTPIWNGESIISVSPSAGNYITDIKDYIVNDTRQSFDGRKLKIFKANANGVDLHYNFYEDNINKQVLLQYCKTNYNKINNSGPTSEGFIGASGINQPESIAVKNFIDKYQLYDYSISYHQRGPVIYYDYTSRWNFGSKKTMDKTREKFKKIAQKIAKTSGSPLNNDRNSPIGFSGWFQQKYHGLSLLIEIGFSNFQGQSMSCPLPASQLPAIWQAQKNVPLELLDNIEKQ